LGLPVERSGAEHLVAADVALGDEPTAAAEAVVPAFALRAGEIAAAHDDLAAVAELGHIAGTAVGAGEEERHSDSLTAVGSLADYGVRGGIVNKPIPAQGRDRSVLTEPAGIGTLEASGPTRKAAG
jgi:hypothetical protein